MFIGFSAAQSGLLFAKPGTHRGHKRRLGEYRRPREADLRLPSPVRQRARLPTPPRFGRPLDGRSGGTPTVSISSCLGRSGRGRGKPAGGYLTKRRAQHELDEILADARRGQLLPPRDRRAACPSPRPPPSGCATSSTTAGGGRRRFGLPHRGRPRLDPRVGEAPLEASRAGTSTPCASRWSRRGGSHRGRSTSTSGSCTASSSARSASTGFRRTRPRVSSASQRAAPATSTCSRPQRSRPWSRAASLAGRRLLSSPRPTPGCDSASCGLCAGATSTSRSA